jgi:2-polyprenyl-3-methyl-5-hydroxy-6-metoxy-1,4-benzoquinol methylase
MKEKILQELKSEQACWNTLYSQARNKLKVLNREVLYLTSPETLYGKYNYWARHNNMRKWEMKLGKSLAELYKVTSMLDLGCGLGSYLEGAISGGTTEVLGYDLLHDTIEEAIPELMKTYVHTGDVGEPMDVGQWDCVLSVEVAEHLVEEQADIFIDNLIKHATRMIVLTASMAGGRYHLNRQPKEYWIGKLALKGAKYSVKDTRKLYKTWRYNGAPGYILNNLMVFFV